MALDYRTMDKKEQIETLPEENKQIYIVQGNLDDERMKELPNINGTILVTGNVFFVENNVVPCGLIVLGDFRVQKVSVRGSLAVSGHAEAERLIVHGDFAFKSRGIMKDLLIVGNSISI